MDVFIRQHRQQLLLLIIVKAAGVLPVARVFPRPKEHVPPHDVSIVVLMTIVLMVDAMHLRPLKDVADPPRGLDVGVIDELAHRGEERVDGARLWVESEERVNQ